MLICEGMFWLLTAPDGSTEGWGTQKGWGLAAAALTDLVAASRLAPTEEKKDPKLVLTDSTPTESPMLDGVLGRLAETKLADKPKKFSSLVQDAKANPESEIVAVLAQAGAIEVEEKRMLGLVPAKYPVLDPRPEAELRQRLRAVLAGTAAPTLEDAALLAILQGLGVAGKVLEQEAEPMSGRELKKRIEELGDGVPAGSAVKQAIDMLNMIILSAVIVPTIVTTT